MRLLKRDNDLSLYMDSSLWTDPNVMAVAKRVKSYADPKAERFCWTTELKKLWKQSTRWIS